MPLLEPKVERARARGDAGERRRRPGLGRGRDAGAAARRADALLGADGCCSRATDLVRYASDASPYRLFPKAVVMAHDADDVAQGARLRARAPRVPVTFRAGGTSLNGQGQTDGILVDVRRHFGGVEVRRRRRPRPGRGPGRVLGHVNRVLAPHGCKLGPDPASTDIATVGGVIANNSGGMRCGVDPRLLLDRPRADVRARRRER